MTVAHIPDLILHMHECTHTHSDVISLRKKSSNHFHKLQKYFSHITYHLWPGFTCPCRLVQAMCLTTFQEPEQRLLALWQIGDI